MRRLAAFCVPRRPAFRTSPTSHVHSRQARNASEAASFDVPPCVYDVGMTGRFVMAYCASGPYKHVASLLERNPGTWFPWGYNRRRIASDAMPTFGSEFELWEIDDIRQSRTARCMAVGSVDFVQESHDYVALTLRCAPGKPASTADEVLARADQGFLAFGDASERSASGVVTETPALSA
jgi:hypothetical protein